MKKVFSKLFTTIIAFVMTLGLFTPMTVVHAENGIPDEGKATVVVYYQMPYRSPGGSITNTHLLEEPAIILDNVDVGTTYTVSAKAIDGYTFEFFRVNHIKYEDTIITGTVTEAGITEIYCSYNVNGSSGEDTNPAKGGNVVVSYISNPLSSDEPGKVLAPKRVEVLEASAGTQFSISPIEIPGYRVLRSSGSYDQNDPGYTYDENNHIANGTIGTYDVSVYYYYEKISSGTVTAHYVDTEGNTLLDDVVLSNYVGETYTTEQKDIEGYTFNNVQGNVTGAYIDGNIDVTYVYEKVVVEPTTPDTSAEEPVNPVVTPKTADHSSAWLFFISMVIACVGIITLKKTSSEK